MRTPKRPTNMQRPARRILNAIRIVCLNYYRKGELSARGQAELKPLWQQLERLRGHRFGALDVRGLGMRLQRPDFTPVMQRVIHAPQKTVSGLMSRLGLGV